MSEQTPPRQGDTVRVVLEGRVNNVTDKTIVVETDRNYMPLPLVDISVEVLERADDPSKALRGEIREHEGTPVVCYGRGYWIYFRADGAPGYGIYRDEQMVGAPVIGAVPGTPAAEAQKPFSVELKLPPYQHPEVSGAGVPYPPEEPVALPLPVRQRVAELLVAGRKSDAVAVLADLGWAHDLALQQVESMPEYQTGRNHRPVKDVPLGTRVFTADGPEPPDDVECVRFFGIPDRFSGLFLKRSVDRQLRWVWLRDPTGDVSAMVGNTNWPVPNARGTFTEVV